MLAVILTLSHIWFKAIHGVLLLSLLWSSFLIPLLFPSDADKTRGEFLYKVFRFFSPC